MNRLIKYVLHKTPQTLLLTLSCLCVMSTQAQSPQEKVSQEKPSQKKIVPATNLDDLLTRVIEGKNADSIENQKRLNRFMAAHDKQEDMLNQAKAESVRLENLGNQINAKIDERNVQIDALEEQLTKRLGNFGELFGVTRQVAGDTRSQIKNSIISAQYPERDIALDNIATGKTLPTMAQLRQLWVTLLQEQMEQGKVARFSAAITNDKGHPEDKEVLRLGAFSAISEGKYLTFKADGQELATISRQPATRYTQHISSLNSAAPGDTVKVAIDPSRGAILGQLTQAPDLLERFHQGGLPGYVVSVLAAFGITLGLFRFISLWITGIKVQRQIKSKTINRKNPLGRVLTAYEENPSVDTETLELKLDDAVLKEISKLESGLSLLKVLAAVAPLIGLLGTVVGMILTFQAITLWGTGDPKIMAGGISQALVTTVQGLVAAIPLLIIHSLASSRARLVQQVLEEQSAGLVARRAEHGIRQTSGPTAVRG